LADKQLIDGCTYIATSPGQTKNHHSAATGSCDVRVGAFTGITRTTQLRVAGGSKLYQDSLFSIENKT